MSALNEITGTSVSEMASALKAGYQMLSANELVTFVKYVRFVLPSDGYVFWIRADQLNGVLAPGLRTPSAAADVIQVMGSFHYSTTQQQLLDQTVGIEDLVFTTDVEIADFNDLQPIEMYIGNYLDFKFSFSYHANFYQQSNVWHYHGHAVYPIMETQLVDDITQFNFVKPVVSNSLPIWLMMQDYAPVYPSYIVPENLTPPYIVAHVEPNDTLNMQPIPWANSEGIWQLCRDRVKLVLFGFRNEEVHNFVQYLVNKSVYPGLFGISGEGFSIQDEKTVQSELNVIAEQKSITLDVTYQQHSVFEGSVQYILKVLPIPVYINPPAR